jgi:hypothetical protein
MRIGFGSLMPQMPLGHPDPLLPDDPAPAPVPPRNVTPPNHQIICEYCDCPLAPNGDYISLSARAKNLRGLEEANEGLRNQVSTITAERDTAARERDEARAEVRRLADPSSKPFWQREAFQR